MTHVCPWPHASATVWLWSHIRHLSTNCKKLMFSLQSAPSLFLKSNFEYLRGNYRKAVKLLNSSNIAEHPGFMKTGKRKLWSFGIFFLTLMPCFLVFFPRLLFRVIFANFLNENVLLLLLQKIPGILLLISILKETSLLILLFFHFICSFYHFGFNTSLEILSRA